MHAWMARVGTRGTSLWAQPIHCWLEDKPVGTGQGGGQRLVEEAQVAKGHRAEVRSHLRALGKLPGLMFRPSLEGPKGKR